MTVILGGGISGLSAAYYALENPKIGALALLEASSRVGGWIKSSQSPSGAIFEKGPRTIRPETAAGKHTLQLVDDLQLTDKIIPISKSHPAAKNRMIYVDNKLCTLPNSFSSLLTIKSPFRRPLISMLWTDFRAPKVEKDDESIYNFVERRLGKDVADYLISPMICGICAGDAKKISVNFLMRTFFEAEQKHGWIMKGIWKDARTRLATQNVKNKIPVNENERKYAGISAKRAQNEKWSVWGLDGGLEQIPIALANNLSSRNVNIRLNSRCQNITFKPDHVEIEVNGKKEKCSRLISSLPANNLGVLLRRQHPQLAQELEAIPTVTVGVINFEFRNNVFPTEAFGCLIPPDEKLPILGIIFDSCIFPQQTTVRIFFININKTFFLLF